MSSKLQQLPYKPWLLQDISFSLSLLARVSKLLIKSQHGKSFWQSTPFKVVLLSAAFCTTTPSSDFHLRLGIQAHPKMRRTRISFFSLNRMYLNSSGSELGGSSGGFWRVSMLPKGKIQKNATGLILKTFLRWLLCSLMVLSFILWFFSFPQPNGSIQHPCLGFQGMWDYSPHGLMEFCSGSAAGSGLPEVPCSQGFSNIEKGLSALKITHPESHHTHFQ